MSQTKAEKATVSEEVVTNGTQTGAEQASNEGVKNIVKKMIASGAKRMNGIRVKNVNNTEKDNYTMVSLTLASAIPGRITEDGGETYKVGMATTMFTSLYAIGGALKEDEELGWMANRILEHPDTLNLILNGSTVDVVQENIAAGEEYRNPFSTRAVVEPQVFEHDTIINHVVGIKLGKTAEKMADRLASKLMGF